MTEIIIPHNKSKLPVKNQTNEKSTIIDRYRFEGSMSNKL